MKLSEGKTHEHYVVRELQGEPKVKKRLQDMGFTKGVSVKIMSFYANNAMIVCIRGTRVVLGKDVAGEIWVDPTTCKSCDSVHHHHHHGKKHFKGFPFGRQHRGA